MPSILHDARFDIALDEIRALIRVPQESLA